MDLHSKSIEWFLYDKDVFHERIKLFYVNVLDTRDVLQKKVFLKISQNSQEDTYEKSRF